MTKFRWFRAAACVVVPGVFNAGTALLAHAQATPSAPLVLLLPASTRASALGNAWVAGRDDYSLFYNPAQIVATSGIGTSVARYGVGAISGALTSGVTVGSLTYGWGVQLVEFKARADEQYPFTPDVLTRHGTLDAMSIVVGAGANYVYKGFRTGLGVKYTEDRVAGETPTALPLPIHHSRVLADVGVSHPFRSGTAALAVQNIGDDGNVRLPLQTSLGWARQFPYKQLDLGITSQILQRGDWWSPAGGMEVGYGWIEGYSAAFRLGAHRPDTKAQRPLTVGGRFTGDRLVLDYALEFFQDKQYAHHLSIRWQ